MCAANIWHHVYILFSILPLNCYHWRDRELSPWTEPGVWSGCYSEVLVGTAPHAHPRKHLVGLLRADSFWTCKCSFSRIPECAKAGCSLRFHTTRSNWKLPVTRLEDVKMDLWERLKFPMSAVAWSGVGLELCRDIIEQPACGGEELTTNPEMKNALSHARTVKLHPDSKAGLCVAGFTGLLEPALLEPRVCGPFLITKRSPKFWKGCARKTPGDAPPINY